MKLLAFHLYFELSHLLDITLLIEVQVHLVHLLQLIIAILTKLEVMHQLGRSES